MSRLGRTSAALMAFHFRQVLSPRHVSLPALGLHQTVFWCEACGNNTCPPAPLLTSQSYCDRLAFFLSLGRGFLTAANVSTVARRHDADAATSGRTGRKLNSFRFAHGSRKLPLGSTRKQHGVMMSHVCFWRTPKEAAQVCDAWDLQQTGA